MEKEVEKIAGIIAEQNKLLYQMSKTLVEQNNKICFLAGEIKKIKEKIQ